MELDLDLGAIATAWEAGDDEALRKVAPHLGVELWTERASALRRLPRGPLDVSDLLEVVYAATHSATGIGAKTVDDDGACGELGDTWWALAVVRDGRVVVGAAVASRSPRMPGQAWPELKPWSSQMHRNKARAQAWAKARKKDRVALRLVARGASAREAHGDDETQAALMRAILEAPEDDHARLVLADWLIARGDAHGELIALQCAWSNELARGDQPDEAATERASRLENRLRERIAGEIGRRASAWEIGRGFVDEVTMSAQPFSKHGERLWSEHPIERFRLRPLDDASLARVAASPALGRVRWLLLGRQREDYRPVRLAPLARSAHLGELRSIALDSYLVTLDDDVHSTFATMDAPRLAMVDVSFVRVSLPALVHGLAANQRISRFEHLRFQQPVAMLDDTLTSVAVGDVLHELGHAPTFTGLRRLELEGCPAPSPREVSAWLEGPNVPALERLGLSGCRFTDEDAMAMSSSPNLRGLRYLDLSRTDVGPAGVRALLHSPQLPVLERLAFGHEDRPDECYAVAELALSLPSSHPLQTLNLALDPDADVALHARLRERFHRAWWW